jgi:basic membrane protein A
MRLHGKSRWLIALLLVLAVFAAACAEEDDEGDNGDNGQALPGEGFKACQVTDEGGIDDKSFNQTAFAGLERAEEELGVETAFLESQNANDYEPNVNALLEQDCDLIITVGFLLGDTTAAAAEANTDQNFAIVDFDFFDVDAGEDVSYDNVRELTFQTDEAAFLAGYLSAGMSESGKLGTFGGINIPTVTIFMNGFEAGMNYYNEQNNADVELLGWNAQRERGLFTGDFTNQDNGLQTTESLLGEGADIIMPVAGPVGLGSAAALQDAGEGTLVWVDTDGCESASEFCDLFLTSVMKNMDVAVFDTINAAVEGNFEGGLYTGTLENDGVGIAPFNEFEGVVPDDLAAEVEEIRAGIIAGEIDVAP